MTKITAVKEVSAQTQRTRQKVVDQIRAESFALERSGVPEGNRAVWITAGEAGELLLDLAEMQPDSGAGREQAVRMRMIAGAGQAAGYIEGMRLWGAVIQIRKIQLIDE